MSSTVWSIGRRDAGRCDVLFDGGTISAIQASLNYMDGKFYLIDNMSTNGSYLSGLDKGGHYNLRGEFAIDLIVHTREMHKKFIELNSSFARDIVSKGSLLL